MKKMIILFSCACLVATAVNAQTRLITQTGQATIFSHTLAEDITAVNNTVTGTIDAATGEVAIAVPVQGFTFEKALMQEHFNSPNFMDSKQFPRITFKGKINDQSSIDFKKDGKYSVSVTGSLTIRAVTNQVTENAIIEVNQGKITVQAKFIVTGIGAYGVGKPMGKKKNNVADDINVTYKGEYLAGQ